MNRPEPLHYILKWGSDRVRFMFWLWTSFDLACPWTAHCPVQCCPGAPVCPALRNTHLLSSAQRRLGKQAEMVFAKSFIFKSDERSFNNLTIDEKFELLRKENDQFFLIVVSLFIFFMQAGFAFLEAGSVRWVKGVASVFSSLRL